MPELKIQALIDARAELTNATEPAGPVVLSTRVGLARNLARHPFPGWANETQRRAILADCEQACAELPEMDRATILELEELSDLEKQVMVERHLISREISSHSMATGVVVSPDQSSAVMINEEDHLRIQVVRAGYQFDDVWERIGLIDSGLEAHMDLAFDESLGYLTACPTNVGTGLRASVMLHLPGLVLANQMEKVVRAVNQVGITVRGLFGEGSDASGSVFQISNQQTLGDSEQEIIRKLKIFLDNIIEHENNARLQLLENEPEKIFDRIGRAYGALSHTHVITSSEAMNFLSLVRLAVDLGMLPADERVRIDRLFIECQPGHIQYAAKQAIDSKRRDVARAAFLREHFGKVSTLNFDKLKHT